MNEKELKKIIRESVKNVISSYRMNDTDELMEYLWLKPNITGLNVDIFVDDGGAYQRERHPLLLFARNGYANSISEFIPFAISASADILDENIDYKISYNDIFAIQEFIVNNMNILKDLANQNIEQQDFVKSLKHSFSLVVEKRILAEMATLHVKDSNLPMDIWLDEGATYRGHAPRLKFRASVEQHSTREYSSMLLTNPPTIENFPEKSPIKAKDIARLQKFVVDNLDLLLKLSNGEINFVEDFLLNMIN